MSFSVIVPACNEQSVFILLFRRHGKAWAGWYDQLVR